MSGFADARKAWLLKIRSERQHAGSEVFRDDPYRFYVFNQTVPNSSRVEEGDVALISLEGFLVGYGWVELLVNYRKEIVRLRCPTCNRTGLKARMRTMDYYCDKCRMGVSAPLRDAFEGEWYQVSYAASFTPFPDLRPHSDLRDCTPGWNAQHSIQALDATRVWNFIQEAFASEWFEEVVEGKLRNAKLEPAADLHGLGPELVYEPGEEDHRRKALRAIRIRQGQGRFRQGLRDRYGEQCLVTGTRCMEIIEAAHISPYRGLKDQDAGNGLLLRADVHTLFDLDLLGIRPDSFEILLHPRVEAEYRSLVQEKLVIQSETPRPSRQALELRWKLFNLKRGA